jgi:hypothetical protein
MSAIDVTLCPVMNTFGNTSGMVYVVCLKKG